jgi:hypothetical protein
MQNHYNTDGELSPPPINRKHGYLYVWNKKANCRQFRCQKLSLVWYLPQIRYKITTTENKNEETNSPHPTRLFRPILLSLRELCPPRARSVESCYATDQFFDYSCDKQDKVCRHSPCRILLLTVRKPVSILMKCCPLCNQVTSDTYSEERITNFSRWE